MAMTINSRDTSMIPLMVLLPLLESDLLENKSTSPIAACGRRARMFTVMMSEMPLPMPRSVICSPSHMSSMVPAVSAITVRMRYSQR